MGLEFDPEEEELMVVVELQNGSRGLRGYLSVLRLLSKALGLAARAKPFRGARFELC